MDLNRLTHLFHLWKDNDRTNYDDWNEVQASLLRDNNVDPNEPNPRYRPDDWESTEHPTTINASKTQRKLLDYIKRVAANNTDFTINDLYTGNPRETQRRKDHLYTELWQEYLEWKEEQA
jgi:hypothetical protein